MFSTSISYTLHLRLLGLGSQIRHQHVAQVSGRLVQVVAHAVSSNPLANNVEVKAAIVSICA